MINYYTEEEDRAFSLKVAKYNSLTNEEEKMQMREEIVSRVYLLLYEIPIRYLYASTDSAADIFIDSQSEVDDIISSYRVCGITFNRYITQVCRFKLLNRLRKKRQRQLAEDSLYLSETEAPYYIELNEPKNPIHEGIEREGIEALTLPELFDYIVSENDGIFESNNEKEKELHRYLQRRSARRHFLQYLLYIPQVEDENMISNLARVLDVDYKVLAEFFIHKHNRLDKAYEARLKTQSIIAKHWILINKLNRTLLTTRDDKEQQKIRKHIDKLNHCQQQRVEALKKSYHGMTQTDISEMLEMKKGTVSQSIKAIKKKLELIAEKK